MTNKIKYFIDLYARDVLPQIRYIMKQNSPQHLFLIICWGSGRKTIMRAGPKNGNYMSDTLYMIEALYEDFNQVFFENDYFPPQALKNLPHVRIFSDSFDEFQKKIVAMREKKSCINKCKHEYKMLGYLNDAMNSNSAIYTTLLAADLPPILPRYPNGDSVIAPGFGTRIKTDKINHGNLL